MGVNLLIITNTVDDPYLKRTLFQKNFSIKFPTKYEQLKTYIAKIKFGKKNIPFKNGCHNETTFVTPQNAYYMPISVNRAQPISFFF